MEQLQRWALTYDSVEPDPDGFLLDVEEVHAMLSAIVTQLRACGYECEAGKLEDNASFRQLEEMVRFTA